MTARWLAPGHIRGLAALGLDEQGALDRGIYSVKNQKEAKLLLGMPLHASLPIANAALTIPFYDYSTGRAVGRAVINECAGSLGDRVLLSTDAEARLYVGPNTCATRMLDSPTRVFWSESIETALLLDSVGFASVALPNFSAWRDDHTLEGLADKLAAADHVAVVPPSVLDSEDDGLRPELRRWAGWLREQGATSITAIADKAMRLRKGEAPTEVAARVTLLLSDGAVIDEGAPLAPLPSTGGLPIEEFDFLRDAGGPAGLVLPPDYTVAPVGRMMFGDQEVLPRPLLITGLAENAETRQQQVSFRYHNGRRWRTGVMPRRATRQVRSFLDALPDDFIADESITKPVLRFLTQYMVENVAMLPTAQLISRFGWHESTTGDRFFVHGSVLRASVGGDEIVEDESQGIAQMMRAWRPRPGGDGQGSIGAMGHAFQLGGHFALMIAAAAAAPLLKLLGVDSFLVHLSGASSVGKTSAVKCAIAMFGDPANRDVLGTWSTTQVGLEARASLISDLPLVVDELGASGADDPALEKIVYMLANGQGRTRGTRTGGQRAGRQWRTVVLSTGEHDLVTDRAATGASARVIQLRARPPDGATGDMVDAITGACATQAGHLGQALLQHLLVADPAELLECKRKAERALGPYMSGLAGRRIHYWGALLVAEQMLHRAFGIGSAEAETMLGIVELVVKGQPIVGVHERALEAIQVRVASCPHRYLAEGVAADNYRTQPIDGWFFKGHLCLAPAHFNTLMDSERMRPDAVLREWKERGIIKTDAGRNQLTVTIDGNKMRVIAVRQDALMAGDTIVSEGGERPGDQDASSSDRD